MSYMMSLGSQPIGELYLTPPGSPDPENGAPKEAWLVGKYYNGGSVKLIKFKEPLEEPEEDSPMNRLQDEEDKSLEFYNYVKRIEETELKTLEWIRDIHDFIEQMFGVKLDPNHKDVDKEKQLIETEKSELEPKIAEFEAWLETRPDLLKCEDAPYLVCNTELLQAARGW